MNKKLVTKESILISLAVLLIAGIAIMSLMGLQDKNKNDEIIKIKQLISDAENMEASVYILPEAYTTSPDIDVPSDVADAMYKRVVAEAEKYYSAKSGILADRIQVLQMAVKAEIESKDYRDKNHFVKKINFISVDVSGDTATVIADVTKQSTTLGLVPEGIDMRKYKTSDKKDEMKPEMKAKLQEDIKNAPKKLVTFTPGGTMRFYYNLAKEDGVWKITSRKGDYLPGQGP
ncbi:hypothetical protein PQ692_00985 [Thermoanaerobacterium thermosaccharolyticum]|uniref:hypothetical protein n=1 Tax=Thermoanaerobacterium thermosaccharolyticum TaxID=1517 RepID=UPI003DA8CAE4